MRNLETENGLLRTTALKRQRVQNFLIFMGLGQIQTSILKQACLCKYGFINFPAEQFTTNIWNSIISSFEATLILDVLK